MKEACGIKREWAGHEAPNSFLLSLGATTGATQIQLDTESTHWVSSGMTFIHPKTYNVLSETTSKCRSNVTYKRKSLHSIYTCLYLKRVFSPWECLEMIFNVYESKRQTMLFISCCKWHLYTKRPVYRMTTMKISLAIQLLSTSTDMRIYKQCHTNIWKEWLCYVADTPVCLRCIKPYYRQVQEI